MAAFAYIWEYRVRPDKLDEFVEAYQPNGPWASLFRKAGGFVRTELLRDRDDPLRFVTVDFWRSRGAWERFQQEHLTAYDKLDSKCALLTTEERRLGLFETVL